MIDWLIEVVMGVGDPQSAPPVGIVDAEIVFKPTTGTASLISASSDRPDLPPYTRFGRRARTTGRSLTRSTLYFDVNNKRYLTWINNSKVYVF